MPEPHLVLRHAANIEMVEAAVWYEEQEAGLGATFLTAVDAAMRALAESPQQFPIVARPLRRARFEVFPYNVYYYERRGQIIVVAILHGARRPSRWRRRR